MIAVGIVIGLVAGYWAGFWWGYINRDEVTEYLKTGKFLK